METKIIMYASSFLLGITGLLLTFFPESLLLALNINHSKQTLLLAQVIGELYFGFATLNWMVKDSRIGGIYNRPVLMANFSHFLISGLAIIKVLLSSEIAQITLWVVSTVYLVLGFLFLFMLFRNPLAHTQNDGK